MLQVAQLELYHMPGNTTLADAGCRFMAALTIILVWRISESKRGMTPGRAEEGAQANPLGVMTILHGNYTSVRNKYCFLKVLHKCRELQLKHANAQV